MKGRANEASLEGAHDLFYKTLEFLDILFKKLYEAGKSADDYPKEVSNYCSCAFSISCTKLEECYTFTDITPAH